MKNFLLILLVVLPITIHAQSQLFPYLKNDKYCLSDENGKIIIDGEFDEIKFEKERKLIAIKKEGRWGIFNESGVQLLPFKLRNYFISNAFSLTSKRLNKNVPIPNLLKIEDRRTQLIYYINPNKILPQYKALITVKEVRAGRRYSSHNDYPSDGMIKVGTTDMKINFIDTTGQLIFKNGVYDGTTISDQFLSIQNEEGKHALFNRKNKRLTDFKYDKFTLMDNESFVKGMKKTKEGTMTLEKFSVLDKNGKEIISDKTYISTVDEKTFIANSKKGGGIYNYLGENIFYFPKGAIKKVKYDDTERFILEVSNSRTGIIDSNGNILLDTIYSGFQKTDGSKLVFHRDKKAGLLSTDLKELWTIDSVIINSDRLSKKGIFKFNKYINYKYYYGLADSLGNIIIDPKYRSINDARCDLLEVKTDSTKSIITLKEKTIIPFTMGQINVNCKEGFIKVWDRKTAKTFDLNGNLLDENKIESLAHTRRNRLHKLYDKKGNEIENSIYRQIFDNYDKKENRRIFFGRHKDRNISFNSIFNEKGIEITPPKYGLPENFTNSKTGENGGVIVVHQKDAIQRKRPFRSGVINFDGEWIIKPDYQITTVFGRELFLTHNFQKDKSILYDRFGKVITKKPYTFISKRNQAKIYNNRIVVGYITNKEDYLNSFKIFKKDDDPKTFLEKMEKITKMKHLLGYIDMEGNEVVKSKYLVANPFKYQYTTVTGINEKIGIYSAVIDLNGNTLLSTDYEELKIMDKDTTILSAKKNGLYGAIDISGNVLVEPKYETINLTPHPNIFYVSDSLSYYLIRNNTVIKNIDPKGNVDIEGLGDNFFLTKINAKVGNSGRYSNIYNIFDKDGNHYKEIEGVNVSSSLFSQQLPEGFVSIKKEKNDKPYIMNIKTGKELRNSLF